MNTTNMPAPASSFAGTRTCFLTDARLPHPSENKIHLRVQMQGTCRRPVPEGMTLYPPEPCAEGGLYTHFQLFLLIDCWRRNRLTSERTVSAVDALRDALGQLDTVFSTIEERYRESQAAGHVSKEPAPQPSVSLRTQFSA